MTKSESHVSSGSDREEGFPKPRWRKKDDPPKPMGTPRQLLTMYLGEAYRYRLAMNDQLERIQTAREEWKKTKGDFIALTLHPLEWGNKVRLTTEVEFFFVAVRGILRMAEAMKNLAELDAFPQVMKTVANAIEKFAANAPHATDLRDFLAHMDRYMAGTGFKELPYPEHRAWVAAPKEDVGLYVGGVVVSVKKTADAAEQLALSLSDAVRLVEEAEQ